MSDIFQETSLVSLKLRFSWFDERIRYLSNCRIFCSSILMNDVYREEKDAVWTAGFCWECTRAFLPPLYLCLPFELWSLSMITAT
jgi:hypothetical protein